MLPSWPLATHRGQDQVDGVEQSLPSYRDVERNVGLGGLGTCNKNASQFEEGQIFQSEGDGLLRVFHASKSHSALLTDFPARHKRLLYQDF